MTKNRILLDQNGTQNCDVHCAVKRILHMFLPRCRKLQNFIYKTRRKNLDSCAGTAAHKIKILPDKFII